MTAWGVVALVVGDALLALPPEDAAVQEQPPAPVLADEGDSQSVSAEPSAPAYQNRPPAAELVVRTTAPPPGFVVDEFSVDELKVPKDQWAGPLAIAPGTRAFRYRAQDGEGNFVRGAARVPIHLGERYEFVIPPITPQRDWVSLGIAIGMMVLGGAGMGATAYAIYDTATQPAGSEGDPVAGIAVLLEIVAAIAGTGMFVGGVVVTGISATPRLQFEEPPERPALVMPSPQGLALGLRF